MEREGLSLPSAFYKSSSLSRVVGNKPSPLLSADGARTKLIAHSADDEI